MRYIKTQYLRLCAIYRMPFSGLSINFPGFTYISKIFMTIIKVFSALKGITVYV